MKIYIVGIGMDGDKTLTAEARNAILGADVLIGARRMTGPFLGLGKPVFESWRPEEIREHILNSGCGTAAVLMSGDCGFFSGTEKLLEALSDFDTEVIPGISTPVFLCAKAGIPWQDMHFVSLHGTDGNIVRNVRRNKRCFFLLGGDAAPADICRKLCEYGMNAVKIYIGSRLAYVDEYIAEGTAEQFTDIKCNGLCAVITENNEPEMSIPSGIPDGEFIRGSVPMTKSEIRAAVASELKICYNDTVWDIGCGTGSVSIECALSAWNGTVISVDKNEEAAALTRENAVKFGCDNIQVVCGSVPEVLAGLQRPDRVFIGGAGGNISAVIGTAFADENSPRTVVTAVTVETLNEAVSAFRERGIEPGITQISAVRTRSVGKHTMFDAQNPVFIITGGGR
ncbi:MAG: precorrin-6y C5,15-methyltransferase (decarboxylating) subunit CbiE [Ruminiclostridium sp.]|nr:precorrin-6y C5,15-methyltransferase (decarboxylating) subunit CbiE [Ruminiclostridium sp.]